MFLFPFLQSYVDEIGYLVFLIAWKFFLILKKKVYFCTCEKENKSNLAGLKTTLFWHFYLTSKWKKKILALKIALEAQEDLQLLKTFSLFRCKFDHEPHNHV